MVGKMRKKRWVQKVINEQSILIHLTIMQALIKPLESRQVVHWALEVRVRIVEICGGFLQARRPLMHVMWKFAISLMLQLSELEEVTG